MAYDDTYNQLASDGFTSDRRDTCLRLAEGIEEGWSSGNLVTDLAIYLAANKVHDGPGFQRKEVNKPNLPKMIAGIHLVQEYFSDIAPGEFCVMIEDFEKGTEYKGNFNFPSGTDQPVNSYGDLQRKQMRVIVPTSPLYIKKEEIVKREGIKPRKKTLQEMLSRLRETKRPMRKRPIAFNLNKENPSLYSTINEFGSSYLNFSNSTSFPMELVIEEVLPLLEERGGQLIAEHFVREMGYDEGPQLTSDEEGDRSYTREDSDRITEVRIIKGTQNSLQAISELTRIDVSAAKTLEDIASTLKAEGKFRE